MEVESPIDVFLTFSREDLSLRQTLVNHLAGLWRPPRTITLWDETKVAPGEDRAGAVHRHFEDARVILCMLSDGFLGADETYNMLDRAQQRRREGEADLILLRCRPVMIPTQLAEFQSLPRDGRPVALWPNQDEAWVDVATGIRDVVDQIRRRRLTKRVAAAREQRGLPPDRPNASLTSIPFEALAGKRVLWVDNRPTGNTLEQQALVELQIQVSNCTSTSEALAELAAHPEYDLILSDWFRYGRPEGPELVIALRAQGLKTPVIFYTKPATPEERTQQEEEIQGLGVLGITADPKELLSWTTATLSQRTIEPVPDIAAVPEYGGRGFTG